MFATLPKISAGRRLARLLPAVLGLFLWNQNVAPATAKSPLQPNVVRNATGPGTLDEVAKLVPGDGKPGDQFGFSASISGNRALVGAPFHNGNRGAAYIYVFDGTSWIEEAELTAGDGQPSDVFGWSVALDGDRALVGAIDADSVAGAVYVFTFDGTSWSEQARLTPDDAEAGDTFGWNISLAGDRALISAIYDNSLQGSAYVFVFDGSTWMQEAKLVAADGAPDDTFGFSVSLSGDRALLGAAGDDDKGSSSGSAYVFAYDGSRWQEQAKLSGSDETSASRFGISVSLDGDRALVGAYGDGEHGADSGAAYVFAADGAIWQEKAKLTASDETFADNFGYAVALKGGRAVVGAREANESGGSSGSAYVFAFDGANWNQEAELAPTDGRSGDLFGYRVSIDGERVLIASLYDSPKGEASGSAYVFELTDVLVALSAPKNNPRIPPEGGGFPLAVTLRNTTEEMQAFDFWTEQTAPDGSVQSPVVGPFKIVLAPGKTRVQRLRQHVSAEMPAGTYTYTGVIGSFPNERIASSSFNFRKTKPDASSP